MKNYKQPTVTVILQSVDVVCASNETDLFGVDTIHWFNFGGQDE